MWLTDGLLSGVELLLDLGQHTVGLVMGTNAPGANKITTEVGFRDTRDLWMLVDLCILLVVLSHLSQKLWFPALARALGAKKYRTQQKFATSFRELLFYCASLYSHWVFLWPEAFMHAPYINLWVGGPHYHEPKHYKLMYLLEVGWYVAGIVFMLTDVRNRKKDFAEMMTHHVMTTLLLSLSYSIGQLRIGFIVVFLHNLADPFLHLAKCFNYTWRSLGLHDVFFACFAIVFIVSRLVIYPQVIYSVFLEGPGVTRQGFGGTAWENLLNGAGMNGLEKFLSCLLVGLLPIHCYWIMLILKMALKMLKGDLKGDPREGDDHGSDSD